MRIYEMGKGWVCLFSRATLMLVAVLLLPGTVRAANVTVVCPSGSINAALAGLDLVGPHTITVTGACVENVFIGNRDRLTIEASPGMPASITALNPNANVVTILESRGIVLRRLVIERGTTGVLISDHSNVVIEGSTIQNNSPPRFQPALQVNNNSIFALRSSKIENNAAIGLGIGGSSFAFLGGFSAAETVYIRKNDFEGINVTSNSNLLLATITVENNAAAGITVFFGGQLTTLGENVIRKNEGGVVVLSGGHASFFGKDTIEYNGPFGVSVGRGGTAQFAGEMPNVTVIRKHTDVGLAIFGTSQVTVDGPHKIQQNGSSAASALGGIGLFSGSSLELLNGAEVSNNVGAGITVAGNATLSLNGSTISNNTEEGVNVLQMSLAQLFGPNELFGGVNNILGNGVADISCDTTSLVAGDLSEVANNQCKRVDRNLGPPRPGVIRPPQP